MAWHAYALFRLLPPSWLLPAGLPLLPPPAAAAAVIVDTLLWFCCSWCWLLPASSTQASCSMRQHKACSHKPGVIVFYSRCSADDTTHGCTWHYNHILSA
jgi:hypothetical protein